MSTHASVFVLRRGLKIRGVTHTLARAAGVWRLRMVFTQELSGKFGKIWAKRPLVRSNGLVCSIANRRHRANRPRPNFNAIAFSLNGARARCSARPRARPRRLHA